MSVDAMTAEYWPISAVLATYCRQNLPQCYTEAVKFHVLWLVEKDMMADLAKKDQNWTKRKFKFPITLSQIHVKCLIF